VSDSAQRLLPQPGARIAFLNADLRAGGSTVFSLHVAAAMVEQGIPAKVFSMLPAHSLAADFERRRVPVARLERTDLIFEDRVAATLDQLRDFAPTVVIASIGFDLCEVLRYVPTGVSRVGVVHAVNEGTFGYISKYGAWLDRVVGVSKWVEEQVKSAVTFPTERISSIELGVPVPKQAPLRDFDPGRPLRLLYVGRLDEPAKRVRLFPKIHARLCETGTPFSWTIAGSGPEREFLETHMPSQPGHEVSFRGLVAYSDLPRLYAAHDVILLTSDSETFSLSLHEGMAMGLVPVASDIPGRVGEIVTPQTGCSVPVNDIGGYANAIRWLHEHRSEMKAMSAASRELITHFYSVEAMAERWIAFVLGLPRPGTQPWPRRWKILPPHDVPDPQRYRGMWRVLRRLGARAMGRSAWGRAVGKAESN